MAREERVRTIKRNGESELEQRLLAPASRNNGIKTDVVVFVTNQKQESGFQQDCGLVSVTVTKPTASVFFKLRPPSHVSI